METNRRLVSTHTDFMCWGLMNQTSTDTRRHNALFLTKKTIQQVWSRHAVTLQRTNSTHGDGRRLVSTHTGFMCRGLIHQTNQLIHQTTTKISINTTQPPAPACQQKTAMAGRQMQREENIVRIKIPRIKG